MTQPPTDWRPIATAPRNGTVIMLRADDAPDIEMRWNPSGQNFLTQPNRGIWEHPSGEITWSEHQGFGPTHWRHVGEQP